MQQNGHHRVLRPLVIQKASMKTLLLMEYNAVIPAFLSIMHLMDDQFIHNIIHDSLFTFSDCGVSPQTMGYFLSLHVLLMTLQG